jgi:hypothetical protein
MSEQIQLIPSKEFLKLNKVKVKRKKTEESLQIAVAKYLKFKYPNLIFNSDLGSVNFNAWQGARAKAMRSTRGQPDIFIFEPKQIPGSPHFYHGMALELKNKKSDVYLDDGTISDCKTKKHIREQAEMLKRLRDKSYWADFGLGFDDCVKKIDSYMSL